jgi:hypothetical protein
VGGPEATFDPATYDAALVEEACRKSGMVWIEVPGSDAPRAAWHVWLDGGAYVVHQGREQPLPGLADAQQVRVVVRSKDKGGRLVTWLARPRAVEPGTVEWDAAATELAGKRLNAPDGPAQPARWARESRITRLEPTGEVVEKPGALPSASHAAPPPASPATTVGPLPFVLGRRPRRR